MQNEYFFVLDALRSDHLIYMPWLKSTAKSNTYVKKVKISSGFCERSELFLSKNPRKSGFLNAFDLNTKKIQYKKPYSWLQNWHVKTLNFISKNKFLEKIFRRIIWEICKIKSDTPFYSQRIPYTILNKVYLTEDSFDFENLANSQASGFLYNIMSKGLKINWKFFTSLSNEFNYSDFQKLELISEKYKELNNFFIPVYIGLPDYLGHEYGPHSKQMILGLKQLDKKIELFYRQCVTNTNSSLSILGDHGMEKVTGVIDVDLILKKIAKKSELRMSYDFYYFLDSTMLRIWWKTNNKTKIKFFINQLKINNQLKKNGYFLNQEDCIKEDLPNLNDIADFVWWAKKGVQIFPDFFHNLKPKKGMHGYLSKDDLSTGFFIQMKKNQITKTYDSFHMKDLYKL